MIRHLLAVTALGLTNTVAAEPPPMLTPEQQQLAATAVRFNREAVQSYQQGRLAHAAEKFRQALSIRQQLYPATTYPDGHPDLAQSLNNLGLLLLASGQPDKALEHFRQELAMQRKLFPAAKFPDGHPNIAHSLGNVGEALAGMGQAVRALDSYQQALTMYQRLFPTTKYPDGHPQVATCLANMGNVQAAMGQVEQAVDSLQRSLAMLRKLYPTSKYPDGHPEIAATLGNLGHLLKGSGQADRAVDYYQQCLEMLRALYPTARFPEGHPILATGLNNMGFVLEAMGQSEKALEFYQQSLAMRQRLFPEARFPEGHPGLAISLNNVAAALKTMGQLEKARDYYQQSFAMRHKLFPRAKYPDGHPDLAHSLTNLGATLQAMGQAEKAYELHQQSLAMLQKLFPATLFPDGHAELAVGLSNMGFVLQEMGQADRALDYYQRSLAMRQRLYPESKYGNGHPDLAQSLLNMGSVLEELGQADRALEHYRQNLAMRQKLFPASKYPAGHPDLAISFNNLASLLLRIGRTDEALTLYRQSLEMQQQLFPATRFPNGHPNLGICLNNMGFALWKTGQAEKAIVFYRQSLEMRQRLFPAAHYPDGHRDLAFSLSNMGLVQQAMGQSEKAVDYTRQSLAMQQRLLRRELLTSSEEAAFEKMAAASPYRDAYLSLTQSPKRDAGDDYAAIWPSQALVTRILQHRHARARLVQRQHGRTGGDELVAKLEGLRADRRRTEQLLHDSRLSANERDRLLAKYAEDRDRIERELVAAMPTLRHWQELDRCGPADLARALPAGTAFIDVIQYIRFDLDPKKHQQTSCYVAFVVTNGGTQRIELGPSTPIDAAIAAWRSAVEAGRDVRGPFVEAPIEPRGDSPGAARELVNLVWKPLARALPPDTKTLYLASDSDLARLPWAALPARPNRVLLEDYAIAQAPHGTFLLDQLKWPRTPEGRDAVLSLGGVEYGVPNWAALPGTLAEVKAIQTMALGECEAASGKDATAAWVVTNLPKVGYAHLATHGAFRADELTAEKKRAAKALELRLLGDETRMVAAKNPLGYVGLVLAGGEVLSGLSILDLPLENLKLVTLSACETGLGQLTGGEGVQGLQRAFHLAGCPNVIATLWKVNDAATAALMAKFYHELWVNKKPPIEALREAQLTIYRRPDLIPDLAGERGAPKLKEAVAVKLGEPTRSSGPRLCSRELENEVIDSAPIARVTPRRDMRPGR